MSSDWTKYVPARRRRCQEDNSSWSPLPAPWRPMTRPIERALSLTNRHPCLIRQAGGIPVLAHPALIHATRPWSLESLLIEMKSYGLLGVEVYYPEHSEAQTRQFLALAERHDLLITGGTDFHGDIKPNIEMGRADGRFHVPFVLYEHLIARLQGLGAR